jgi:protein SCO1/2
LRKQGFAVVLRRPTGWIGALLIASAFVFACGAEVRRFPAHGIVMDVMPSASQVMVAHDEIPGLMPAMTMNFSVSDPKVLAKMSPGKVIDFVLSHEGREYRIIAAQVVGEVKEGEGWSRFGDVLVQSDPAPDFHLEDQQGRPLSRADLEGKMVLLDFIFTRCPGPCPILTSTHVAVQRQLPEEVRARTSFVSISLDPAFDTPPVLEQYAMARGIDTRDWWLLTGKPVEVDEVIRAFGVGSTRAPDGTIEHLVVTFLIDEHGKIVKRYMGQEHSPEQIVADLERLAS